MEFQVRYIIPVPLGALLIVMSAALCGLETLAYYNVPIWHGNVRPTSVWLDNGTPTVNFEYADGRRGWTKDNLAALAFSQHRLDWLWCKVSRSGSASCSTGVTKTSTIKSN